MDYKKLLEKYWKGETSIEEEKTLKSYFESGEAEAELETYKPLFQYFGEAKKENTTTSVSDYLESLTENTRVVPFSSRFSLIRGIAAAVLLLLSVSFLFTYYNQPTKSERLAEYWANKEIKDPQLAYKKTKAALLLVSKKLNGGTNAALNQVRRVQQMNPLNIKSPD